jgi:hypothetical protein
MADEGGASAAVIEGENPYNPSALANLIDDARKPPGQRGGRSARTPRREGAKKK